MCYNGMGDGMLNESLLDKKKRYLVGVSGGVDSMALLDMLVKKGLMKNWFFLIAKNIKYLFM